MTEQIQANEEQEFSRFELWKEDLKPHIKEFKYSLHLLKQNPLVITGIVITLFYVFIAIFAPWIAPYDPELIDLSNRNLPPLTNGHLFGTDNYGMDIFSRVIWGTRVDFGMALIVVLVTATFGTILGASSGYLGGKYDELIMRITDIFFAFPGLILAMAIVTVIGRSLQNIMFALMFVWWPGYTRLIRAQALAEREKLYVEAARSVGASDLRIIFKHIIPNSIQPLIVAATMDLGGVLLTAAGLSFIGFGAEAGAPEWGWMIAAGQQYFLQYPWEVLFPGLAIFFAVLAFNLMGDGMRDIMDPRLRR